MDTILWYLIPSLVMFCCGVYGFITRRNMIAMLISLELMLNAVDINFVVFNRFLWPGALEAHVLHLIRHSAGRRRDRSGNRHYHQCFPRDEDD